MRSHTVRASPFFEKRLPFFPLYSDTKINDKPFPANIYRRNQPKFFVPIKGTPYRNFLPRPRPSRMRPKISVIIYFVFFIFRFQHIIPFSICSTAYGQFLSVDAFSGDTLRLMQKNKYRTKPNKTAKYADDEVK